ncbi:TolB family protein [Gemmatimonas sp.]|uniref:TolB family protein n=1 Tax=Gemmatimonas sp. TaxID=1962908 RepID=UPI003DA37395
MPQRARFHPARLAILAAMLALPQRPVRGQLSPALGAEQGAPTVRWRVVEGKSARVITPEALLPEARRVAAIIDRVAARDTLSLRTKAPRIDVVLRHQLAESNGFVALAPRRSEFFLQPPQQEGLLGSGDWLTLLAVHEYRHVKQFSAARSGFTGALSAVLGEPAWLILSMWSVPTWYYEGDATVTETALTSSGRGRLPMFDADFRAQLLELPIPSYNTMMSGSFAQSWPSQYVHGYHLINAGRQRFGPDVWDRALHASARRSFRPLSLSLGLRRAAGLSANALHDQTLRALQDSVRALAAATTPTPANPVSGIPESWTRDDTPQWETDSSMVSVRYGLVDRPQLVRHRDGRVTRLRLMGPATGAPLSVGGRSAAWVESRPDPRYALRSYNVIMLHDLATGKATQVGDTTRYTSVTLSPDGSRLATLEQHPDSGMALVILGRTGDIQRRERVPAGDQLIAPRFTRDGRALLLVRTRRGEGRRVERCTVESGACQPLSPWATNGLGAPSGNDTLVVAFLPVNGRDQIVAWRAATNRWYQVTERPVGAIDPVLSPDGRQLAFTDHTASGRRVVTMAVNPGNWREISVTPPDLPRVALLARQEGGSLRPDTIGPDLSLKERAYSRFAGWWNPVGVSLELPPLGPDLAATLQSRNVLGTLGVDAGGRYNTQEQAYGAQLGITYAARLPILRAWADQRTRRDDYPQAVTSAGPQKGGEWSWQERSIGAGVDIPLDFTRSAYSTQLNIGAHIEERRVSESTLPAWFGPDAGSVRPITFEVRAHRTMQWIRDIIPERGQAFEVVARQTPFGGTFEGTQWYGRVMQFIPGLSANHGLRFDAGIDWQSLRERADAQRPYRFATALPFARGYDAVPAPRLTRLSAEYVAPLWYPDWTLPRGVQVRRIRTTLFADATTAANRSFVGGNPITSTQRFRSAGVEVWMDATWFHPRLALPLGFRWSQRFDGAQRGGRLGMAFGQSF